MLDNEQRQRLMTYGRNCEPGVECEPPLGCLSDARYFRSYCTDSQCLTDMQCPEGQVCQSLATWGDGPQVRVCVPIGVRREGETCSKLPDDKEEACAAGLLCGGRALSWCARPCRLGDTQSCPQGFFCADTIPQPVCLPTCEVQQCPSEQQCVSFGEGASKCMRVYGLNCKETPCPEGHSCIVWTEGPRQGEVWMQCIALCGGGSPPCKAGWVCNSWGCVQPCDPQGPEVCDEGYSCHRTNERMPYSCVPGYWRDRSP
jgi:Cys-rich repeat protein